MNWFKYFNCCRPMTLDEIESSRKQRIQLLSNIINKSSM